MFDLFLTEVVHHVSRVEIVMTSGTRNLVQNAQQMCRQSQHYMGTVVVTTRTEHSYLKVKITISRRTENTEEEDK